MNAGAWVAHPGDSQPGTGLHATRVGAVADQAHAGNVVCEFNFSAPGVVLGTAMDRFLALVALGCAPGERQGDGSTAQGAIDHWAVAWFRRPPTRIPKCVRGLIRHDD